MRLSKYLLSGLINRLHNWNIFLKQNVDIGVDWYLLYQRWDQEKDLLGGMDNLRIYTDSILAMVWNLKSMDLS